MIQKISESQFCDSFTHANRENNFSYEGRKALYNHFEEVDENYELDVIAICCDFNEYENIAEFQQDYSEDYESIEDIEKETLVIRLDGEGFIIQQF